MSLPAVAEVKNAPSTMQHMLHNNDVSHVERFGGADDAAALKLIREWYPGNKPEDMTLLPPLTAAGGIPPYAISHDRIRTVVRHPEANNRGCPSHVGKF